MNVNQCCQLGFESGNYLVEHERFEFYGTITIISVMFTNKTLMQFAFKDTFLKKCINGEREKTLAVSNLLSIVVFV